MAGSGRKWWPTVKLLLALIIVIVIGRQFARDLRRPELWQRSLHAGWLVLAGGLYLAGLSFSALYWYRLMGHLGRRPPLVMALRAYYIGHLGKYVPGKVATLFVRATMVQPGGVRLGVGVVSSFYEVLVTMASGALFAAVVLGVLGIGTSAGLEWEAVQHLVRFEPPPVLVGPVALVLSLLVAALFATPALPPLFNRVLVRRFVAAQPGQEDGPPPRLRFWQMGEGIALTTVGWVLIGLGLACTLRAILGEEFPGSGRTLLLVLGVMSLSHAAGFAIFIVPGTLGVREFFLTLFLTPELVGLGGMSEGTARGTAVLTALVLRLVWTIAELFAAGVVYRLPRRVVSSQ